MQIYKVNDYRKRSNKSIDNKNIDLKSIIKDNVINENKKKNTFINMKKQIFSKNNEGNNIIKKKSNININKKSIDNEIKNNKSQNNLKYINNTNICKDKKIWQTKIPNKQIRQTNNRKKYSINEKLKKEKNNDTNNIYNKNFTKIQNNLASNFIENSNNKFPDDKTTFNELYSESKDGIYEKEILKYNNKKVLTTFVQIEDLTKIPDRKSTTQNKYADYDYIEAKRAAVTCRRIEYSYNLRNVIKSEICLDEVIMIQRWWRKIIQKKNEEILKELRIFENLDTNNIQRYILFLNKIQYIYIVHLLKKFINNLKIRYGKLYYKNYFNRNALKIQNAFRKTLSKRKNESQKKLVSLLNKYIYKSQKEELFDELNSIRKIFNKIKFLQSFMKYYILRKNENYLLDCAHDIHPYIYFLLKYKIPETKRHIRKYKRKRKRFLNFVYKWKQFHDNKKILKNMMFLENIKFIVKKKYFIFFILRLVERINAMITYFLLQPLMKKIMHIYYYRKLFNTFSIWKKKDQLIKNKNILAINLIKKILKIFTINSLIKKLKYKNK